MPITLLKKINSTGPGSLIEESRGFIQVDIFFTHKQYAQFKVRVTNSLASCIEKNSTGPRSLAERSRCSTWVDTIFTRKH